MSKRKSRQPSSQDIARVAQAFDPTMLSHLCETWDFTTYATKTTLPGNALNSTSLDPDRFYWYQDNGSDILAVAHLDTVQGDRTCQVIDTAGGKLAVSGALDDRLGVYVILELLPTLGVTCDWLLTCDEEAGGTTASEFAEDFYQDGHKEYNWVIEFDRGGTDVVMYQYETAEYKALVEDAGAVVGEGIYSDICELETLGCLALNWGVGYEDYHSPRSHAWLDNTFRMVARFLQFHEKHADTFLRHETPLPDTSWLNYREEANTWDKDDLDWMKSVPPVIDQDGHPDDDWINPYVEADCSHYVDLSDDSTYVEWGDEDFILCPRCAEAEGLIAS